MEESLCTQQIQALFLLPFSGDAKNTAFRSQKISTSYVTLVKSYKLSRPQFSYLTYKVVGSAPEQNGREYKSILQNHNAMEM